MIIAVHGKTISKTALRGITALMFFAVCAFADNYTKINSYDDLLRIGKDLPLNGSYELTGDINASASRHAPGGLGFTPIGTAERPFSGTFFGGGFAVHGLYINRPTGLTSGNVGLFGYIDTNGVVSSLGVHADTIIGSHAVGVLAGVNYGEIISCYTLGYVNARRREESNAGGLVGVNGGGISKSYSAAFVEGVVNVGGLIGFLAPVVRGIVTESYAAGRVMGSNYTGGLIGYIFGGTIDRCFSTTLVIGTGERSVVGGLVGQDFDVSNNSWNVRGRAGGNTVKAAAISSSFWDIEASNVGTSTGGDGKTTAQMLDPVTFKDWDLDDEDWVVTPGMFYPQLKVSPMCTLEYRASKGGHLKVSGITDTLESQEMELGFGVSGLRVTAVGNEGFVFWKWDDGVTTPAREDVFTDFTTDRRFTYTAQFIVPSFVLYAAGTGGKLQAGGSKELVDYYNDQEAIEGAALPAFTAVALEGYRFSRWSDGVTTHTRSGDKVPAAGDTLRIRAIFELEENANLGKRQVAVNGRNINITAPKDMDTQIRVLDMRGRTVRKHTAKGSARIPLKNIPAGMYMVEVREESRRVNVSTMVLR